MNFKISSTIKPDIHRLSVNLRLPRLDLRHGFLDWHQSPLRVRSPYARRSAAQRLAVINRGQTPFELANPVGVYAEFLDELSLVEGLARIVDVGPYSIDFLIGELFEADVIGQLLAQLVQSHFYPQEPLVLVA